MRDGDPVLLLFSAWAFETLGLTELRLWAREDNIASRRAAERAGYERDPEHDQTRTVTGELWQTVAYRRVPGTASATS